MQTNYAALAQQLIPQPPCEYSVGTNMKMHKNFKKPKKNYCVMERSREKKIYFEFGDSLARSGKIYEAFDIYAFIAENYFENGGIPLDRLNTLTISLIGHIAQISKTKMTTNSVEMQSIANHHSITTTDNNDINITTLTTAMNSNRNRNYSKSQQFDQHSLNRSSDDGAGNIIRGAIAKSKTYPDMKCQPIASRGKMMATATDVDFIDPLLCPVCKDILRCPVTANCGHTFCRLCCESISMCLVCRVKFPWIVAKDIVSSQMTVVVASSLSSPVNEVLSSLSLCDFNCDSAEILDVSSQSQLENLFFNRNSLNDVTAAANQYDHMVRLRRSGSYATNLASGSRNFRNHQTNSLEILSNRNNNSHSRSINRPNSNKNSNSVDRCSMKFMPDILVRRLVEKWWGPDLQAKKTNETVSNYMNLNLLDEALRYCNVSLEKSPSNFNSLLLRAEVLRKLCHYQSSLADIDNALKSQSTSPKAHYQRALALSELGRLEEALLDNCLAVSLDKTTLLSSSELFKHDLAKLLQKMLAQSSRKRYTTNTIYNHLRRHHSTTVSPYTTTPYNIFSSDGNGSSRFSSKKMGLLTNANGDHFSHLSSSYHYDRNDIIVGDDKGYEVHYDLRQIYGSDCDNDMKSQRHGSRKHTRRKSARRVHVPNGGEGSHIQGSKLNETLEKIEKEVLRITKTEMSEDGQQRMRQQQLTHIDPSLIDASDFDCVLCCRTFWKPVVTPCGHTYCWVCLDRCMDYSSSCPLCMSPLVEQHHGSSSSSPVPFILAKRPVTKFLEAAMKRFIPEYYEKRFRQEMDLEPSVPVFICTTAFPTVPCPLFVYEPRYRLMVRRAVESGEKQFGIVQPHNGKSRYFDIGTILDIRDCVLLGDGCSILSTVGCKRFKILARNEKDGYETAKVEYIYDEIITEENVPIVSSMHGAVLSKAIEWYDSLSIELKQEILRSFGEMPPVEENWERVADGPAWAWWIIALLPLNQQLKVDILATTSLEKRLRAIEKTLDYMSGSFRKSQQSCVVVQCEGIQSCPAVECCQRTSAELSSADEAHTAAGFPLIEENKK